MPRKAFKIMPSFGSLSALQHNKNSQDVKIKQMVQSFTVYQFDQYQPA